MSINPIANRILDYLGQSIILQAFLTVAIFGATLYLIVAGRDVPDSLNAWTNIILGAYFGSKATSMMYRSREK